MLNSAWNPLMLTKPLTAFGSILILLGSSFSAQAAPVESTDTNSNSNSNLEQTSIESIETLYTVGPGDRIRLDVLNVKEYSGEYNILVDGTASFPLVGTFKVQDLTLIELTELLTQSYSRYIKRPVLSVGLISPRPLKINISGEVNNPGVYTLAVVQGQKFPFLTDILKQAGGTRTTADVSTVRIIRQYRNKEQVYTLNLFTLLNTGDPSQDISLRDGDRIFVPTKNSINQAEVRQLSDANFGIQPSRTITVAIVGEIYRPGTYRLGEPDSILTGANSTNLPTSTTAARRSLFPRVSSALQQAGGTKPLANIRNVEIQRLTRSGEIQVIPVDLWALLQAGNVDQDIILQDGDTITVPTAKRISPKEAQALASASFSPDRIRINVIGEVLKPGTVEIPPNTPLNQAILSVGGFDQRRADQSTVHLIRLNPNGTVSTRDVNINLAVGINEETNPILRPGDVVVVNRSGLTQVTDTIGTIFSPFAPLLGIVGTFNNILRNN